MSFEVFVGGRYLKAKKRQAFISLITFLSVAGVTVGVMVLIVVIAVMSGAESDFTSHILQTESHIVLMRYGGPFSEYHNALKHVDQLEGIDSASPFVYSQTMLRSPSGVAGAVLKGVEADLLKRLIKKFNDISGDPEPPQNAADANPAALSKVFLGKELARTLKVRQGDVIYLMTPQAGNTSLVTVPETQPFKVAGIFATGMYEYDKTFVYIDLKDAQRILHIGDAVTGIEVRIQDIYRAGSIAKRMVADLGFPFWARDWMQMNRNVFSALKLQKTVFFIILTLIVLVAALNISSTLFMTVKEKTRDIAILKAMGATNRSIRRIFVFKGMVISLVGTLLGIGLGLGLCTLLKRYKFIDLPGDVYYFTTLPVQLELSDVLIITCATLLICFLATLYPALQASRLDPVEAIRYE